MQHERVSEATSKLQAPTWAFWDLPGIRAHAYGLESLEQVDFLAGICLVRNALKGFFPTRIYKQVLSEMAKQWQIIISYY